MVGNVARAFAMLLLVVHVGLGVWALVGFAELALAEVPWSRISNPLFSRPMLSLQWTLVLVAAATYIGGYLARWRRLPVAMLVIYAAMAATCAFQTFAILTAPTRFVAMAVEYAADATIVLFLFRSTSMRQRLGRI